MDVKEYTAQNLGEQMVLAEYHLTDYLRETGGIPTEIEEAIKGEFTDTPDKDFCIECLAKHALAIGGFAKEGTQFFDADPYFSEVAQMATALYNTVPSFDRDKALKFYKNLRFLRKNLVAKHLILGDRLQQFTNHLISDHIKS